MYYRFLKKVFEFIGIIVLIFACSRPEIEKEARLKNKNAYEKISYAKINKKEVMLSSTPEFDGVFVPDKTLGFPGIFYIYDGKVHHVFAGQNHRIGGSTIFTMDKNGEWATRDTYTGLVTVVGNSRYLWSQNRDTLYHAPDKDKDKIRLSTDTDTYLRSDVPLINVNAGIEQLYSLPQRERTHIFPGGTIFEKKENGKVVATLITGGSNKHEGTTNKLYFTRKEIDYHGDFIEQRDFVKESDLLVLFNDGHRLVSKRKVFYGTYEPQEVKVLSAQYEVAFKMVGVRIENEYDEDAWYTGTYYLKGENAESPRPLIDWIPACCYVASDASNGRGLFVFTPQYMGEPFTVVRVKNYSNWVADNRRYKRDQVEALKLLVDSVEETKELTILDEEGVLCGELAHRTLRIAARNSLGKDANYEAHFLAVTEDIPAEVLSAFRAKRTPFIFPEAFAVSPKEQWIVGEWDGYQVNGVSLGMDFLPNGYFSEKGDRGYWSDMERIGTFKISEKIVILTYLDGRRGVLENQEANRLIRRKDEFHSHEGYFNKNVNNSEKSDE